MSIQFEIRGHIRVPDGTQSLAEVANQFRLPTGQIISVHPVIEMASSAQSDDHRDLGFAEAEAINVVVDLYDRDCTLCADD